MYLRFADAGRESVDLLLDSKGLLLYVAYDLRQKLPVVIGGVLIDPAAFLDLVQLLFLLVLKMPELVHHLRVSGLLSVSAFRCGRVVFPACVFRFRSGRCEGGYHQRRFVLPEGSPYRSGNVSGDVDTYRVSGRLPVGYGDGVLSVSGIEE